MTGSSYYTPVVDGGLAGGWLVHLDVVCPSEGVVPRLRHAVWLVLTERDAQAKLAELRTLSPEQVYALVEHDSESAAAR